MDALPRMPSLQYNWATDVCESLTISHEDHFKNRISGEPEILFLKSGRFRSHKIGFHLEIGIGPISIFQNPGFRSHKSGSLIIGEQILPFPRT